MTDVVLVDRLGDINFGLPEDLAPHRKPWAYYEILGIDTDATEKEIRQAVKKLAVQNHPDRFDQASDAEKEEAGNRMRLINEIAEVLLDDGGELGAEWSKRRLYNNMSDYGDFFGAVHLMYEGERTVTISEELIDLYELERRGVQAKQEFETQNPEIVKLVLDLEQAVDRRDQQKAKVIHGRLVEAMAEKEGVPVPDFKKMAEEGIGELKARESERKKRNRVFENQLMDELKRSKGDKKVVQKLYDIWYNGMRDELSIVTFETSGWPVCQVVGFKETDHVVRMGIKGIATFSGMRKVHFKAEYGHVKITDAHLEGIFQVAKGSVTIEYKGSSYGTVIRARAPRVDDPGLDFVRSGDLYIPRDFATDGWDEKEPKVDIAVFDGTVNLKMEQKLVQQRSRIPYEGNDLLENILNENAKQDNRSDDYLFHNIIFPKKKYF